MFNLLPYFPCLIVQREEKLGVEHTFSYQAWEIINKVWRSNMEEEEVQVHNLLMMSMHVQLQPWEVFVWMVDEE